jgi:hypothetical protein
LHLWESNHTAQATFDALPENCVFYISRMYEFLHRLGQSENSRQRDGAADLAPTADISGDCQDGR